MIDHANIATKAEQQESAHATLSLQRKCDCGEHTAGGGACAACSSKRSPLLQRMAVNNQPQNSEVPSIVSQVLRSPGQSLDGDTRQFMETRFDHDFSRVRLHVDSQAGESARAVNALAYTVGSDVVFGPGRYAPSSNEGRKLMAHELAHVVQQETFSSLDGGLGNSSDPDGYESNADTVAYSVLSGGPVAPVLSAWPMVQRRAAPYISKVTVHLAPPQSADLEWNGTPPAEATGSDHFTVSTGKGYGDVGDPPNTCTRMCCSDAMTQCAPPWNRPTQVGACCTYYGDSFWTGTPLEEHNTWKWWTPIQPYYSSRGIALHQHPDVTGQPIGHGCVRMDEPNAKRIFDFSNGQRTNVTVDGRAAPVACDASRQCPGAGGSSGAGGTGSAPASSGAGTTAAMETQEPIPGQEGVAS